MAAAALLVFAAATAPGASATTPEPKKTLTVKITSGPEGTVSTPHVSFSFIVEGAEESGTLFHCALDTPEKPTPCNSPLTLGPLAPGSHTFYVLATNEADDAYSPLASRTFTIAAPTSPGAGGSSGSATPPSGAATPIPTPLTPIVSSLAQSASRWREGSSLARISRAGAKPPIGTTFSFTLNEAATLRLEFSRIAGGRLVGGRCVPATRRDRGKRACQRTVKAGSLTLLAPAGSDRVRFEGRLSATRKLEPGRYTLAMTALASSGLSSTRRSLTFTIVS
jgi:hypothetical protein